MTLTWGNIVIVLGVHWAKLCLPEQVLEVCLKSVSGPGGSHPVVSVLLMGVISVDVAELVPSTRRQAHTEAGPDTGRVAPWLSIHLEVSTWPLEFVLVHSGCCTKPPQTRRLQQFLSVLEAGKSNVSVPADQCLVRSHFLLHRSLSSC